MNITETYSDQEIEEHQKYLQDKREYQSKQKNNFSFSMNNTNQNHEQQIQQIQPRYNSNMPVMKGQSNSFNQKKRSNGSQNSQNQNGSQKSNNYNHEGFRLQELSNSPERSQNNIKQIFMKSLTFANEKPNDIQKQSGESQNQNHNQTVTIQSNVQDSLQSVSLTQDDQYSPMVKITKDNKSIFSEITDKPIKKIPFNMFNTSDNRNSHENNQDILVNEDFHLVTEFDMNYDSNLKNPAIFDNLPLIRRPNHFGAYRAKSSNKVKRGKNSLFNNELSMKFSLFPGSQSIEQEQQHQYKRNLIKEQENQNLNVDPDMMDYVQNMRQQYSSSQQRSKQRFLKNESSKYIFQKNQVFAPQVFIDQVRKQDLYYTMSSTQVSNFNRARSSHNPSRPQTMELKNRFHGDNTTLDIDPLQVQFDQGSIQGASSVVNGSGSNFYFDGGFGLDSIQNSRPQTASMLASKSHKARNLLQSIHRSRALNQIDLKNSATQQTHLNIRQALDDLRQNQDYSTQIEQADKVNLCLIDKMNPRVKSQSLSQSQQRSHLNSQYLFAQSTAIRKDQPQKQLKPQGLSLNPYCNSSVISEEVSQRVYKKLNSTAVFNTNLHKNDDEQLYENLKDIIDQDQNTQLDRENEVNIIKNKCDQIQTEFLTQKQKGRKSSVKSSHASSKKMKLKYNTNFLNTSNKMEPLTSGPHLKSKKEFKAKQDRDQQELVHGYSHIGSPFDHPYLQWMDGLRKQNGVQLETQQKNLNMNKNELRYSQYLTEVKSLNIVKDFLAENRNTMSIENKNQLIQKIIAEQIRLKKVEKTFKKLNML